jgi:hypothetical protein
MWGVLSDERTSLPFARVTVILHVIKCMYIQHIQNLCQARLSTAGHALSIVALATTAVQSLDRRQVLASYISCVGVHLVRCCEYLHFHDFV